MEKDHSLHNLIYVLEHAPSEHDFAHFNKLEPEALSLQLDVGLSWLLVHQGQLGILRPLEEVEVSGIMLRIVNGS